jgi:hypothetical protein
MVLRRRGELRLEVRRRRGSDVAARSNDLVVEK